MTASMFIGQSVSVYILQLVEWVLGQSGYRFRFTFLAVMLGIAAVEGIFNGVYRRKDLKKLCSHY
jgi:hypothetical protein